MSCVCVLRPVSVFCVLRMLGANTMLGAMDNMEFINVLSSLISWICHSSSKIKSLNPIICLF